ncbi:four-carbon acid sugar kinase family protein [Siphonobacter aquaeclarae]|uniref:Uncharacterized conserved protein YgbK, DUF1537 family n=1 Tax=Siphonobacter aquaeclarae TaxID=563176 RepID=A0A1G9J122_9BACT|nr:four-carbon acid sugar kinase family protein [Siphonobacter aquaeclarae]SDL30903.1 Uncharacterized conserved protein YgbK, DUF1537 family [Siphonobacter aquaeclarae]
MIAVLADDLTGAAEIAGIGRRYGLRTELALDIIPDTQPDLLVVTADTRSLSEEEAIHRTGELCRKLLTLNPEWVYKKIDSVLRGHVRAELEVQRAVFGQQKVWIVPAHPLMERGVKNGLYVSGGRLISETAFAHDPEFPVKDARVTRLLNLPEAVSVRVGEPLPAFAGWFIGEATSPEEIAGWAMRCEGLLAGAAPFFEACLRQRAGAPVMPECPVPGKRRLYICGSTFRSEKTRRAAQTDGNVVVIPRENDQKAVLPERDTLILAAPTEREADPNAVKYRMATYAAELYTDFVPEELLIEGGATAAAVLRQLNFRHLTDVNELAPGVVRCRLPDNRHVILKPGSYPWAPGLWVAD